MKISYSRIEIGFREMVEDECRRHVEKLNRLMKRYVPDLVKLHCGFEKTPRRVEYNFSLNLALPTGNLHATGSGADVRASATAAFAEIEGQFKKHQEKLRKDFVWKRKRARGPLKAAELIAEE
jgi:ribosomal subunit interface protein